MCLLLPPASSLKPPISYSYRSLPPVAFAAYALAQVASRTPHAFLTH
jgi:hypothetical protein